MWWQRVHQSQRICTDDLWPLGFVSSSGLTLWKPAQQQRKPKAHSQSSCSERSGWKIHPGGPCSILVEVMARLLDVFCAPSYYMITWSTGYICIHMLKLIPVQGSSNHGTKAGFFSPVARLESTKSPSNGTNELGCMRWCSQDKTNQHCYEIFKVFIFCQSWNKSSQLRGTHLYSRCTSVPGMIGPADVLKPRLKPSM